MSRCGRCAADTPPDDLLVSADGLICPACHAANTTPDFAELERDDGRRRGMLFLAAGLVAVLIGSWLLSTVLQALTAPNPLGLSMPAASGRIAIYAAVALVCGLLGLVNGARLLWSSR